MDEQAIIKAGVIKIFNENGYDDLSSMTQRDFDHIGEQLRLKSGILISGTTIKRLGYGEFSRLPQIATLNAIANYFNYKTWQDYKADQIKNSTEPKSPEDKPLKKGKHKLSFIHLSILGLIAVGIGGYFIGTGIKTIGDAENASFSFRKNTSNDIPNSVVFNYNVDNVRADSFFIQQSWDENRRVKIYKNKYTITDIYYEPGYHIAKLIANDSVIREVDVSIPTDRWFFYAIDNIANYTPEYIKGSGALAKGSLGLSVSHLRENGIDADKDKRYHYVYFQSQMNQPSDNFRFKTRVRMQQVRRSACPYIEVELYCQRSFMTLRSTTKGCAHQALVQFGEQIARGAETDLLPISFDVHQWTDIEIVVKNKVATVKVNGRDAYSTRFVMDTKNLAGLGFISNGLCEVDHAELTGLDGKVVYNSDF